MLSGLTTAGACAVFLKSIPPFLAIPIIILIFATCLKILNCKTDSSKGERVGAFVALSLFTLVHICGNSIYHTHHLCPANRMLMWGVFALAFSYVGAIPISLGIHILWRRKRKTQWHHKGQIQWGCAILFFCSYLICLWAYSPGICAYDISTQTEQALGLQPVSRFHPPLHTFLWWGCLKIQEITGISSLFLYGLFQILITALIFSRFQRLLMDHQASKSTFILSFLFFAVNPVICIFAGIMTKDVLFGLFVLNFSMDLLEWRQQNRRSLAGILADLLLCMLLRNNMIYAVVAWLLILLVFKHSRKLAGILCISAALYFLINGPIFSRLYVRKGEVSEMLSVPVQQIGAILKNEGEKTEIWREDLSRYMDVDRAAFNYNPRFADPLKNVMYGILNGEEILRTPEDFVRLWLDMCRHFPEDTISAFLDLGIQYWYMGAAVQDPYADRAFIETHIDPHSIDLINLKLPVQHTKPVPWLFDFYESFASTEAFSKTPLELLFSLALPFWISVFTCIFSLVHRQRKAAGISLLLILITATFLLGPVCCGRYILYNIFEIPLLLACLCGILDREESTGVSPANSLF